MCGQDMIAEDAFAEEYEHLLPFLHLDDAAAESM